jgi:hypothetical protein
LRFTILQHSILFVCVITLVLQSTYAQESRSIQQNTSSGNETNDGYFSQDQQNKIKDIVKNEIQEEVKGTLKDIIKNEVTTQLTNSTQCNICKQETVTPTSNFWTVVIGYFAAGASGGIVAITTIFREKIYRRLKTFRLFKTKTEDVKERKPAWIGNSKQE